MAILEPLRKMPSVDAKRIAEPFDLHDFIIFSEKSKTSRKLLLDLPGHGVAGDLDPSAPEAHTRVEHRFEFIRPYESGPTSVRFGGKR